MTTALPPSDLDAAAHAISVANSVVDAGVEALSRAGGPDAAQVLAYDVSHAAAAVRTAEAGLAYGANGKVEALIACVFVADVVADLAARTVGRCRLWGVAPDWMDPTEEFTATYRDPELLAVLADQPGPRHLDADFEL